ncbi:cbb3-type cytochrome c oxidase N-terminal domain-containing protein, partial [[Eubacterium] cellulosolvens]
DNSLPPWWVAMFYITIGFAVVYFSYYHFLGYGPGSVEEYEMEMEYTLQETVYINPETEWYSFELNKQNDYTIELTVLGEHEKLLQTGNYHQKAFTIEVENRGNVFNVVDLVTENVPAGWVVTLSNHTVPLDIIGTHSKERITVDITIPVNAYASNKININGIPRSEDAANTKSVTITVNTLAKYGFELGFESDLERGINFNDSLLLNLSVKNTGNADDELLFKFSNVPYTWNVSIGEAWQENTDVIYEQDTNTFIHTITQTDIYKNLTIQVKSPTAENGSYDEKVTFLVGAWSENDMDIEYTKEISVTIRKPDVTIQNLKILNTDLKTGDNITIQATVKNDYCYSDNVNFSLEIDGVIIENKTVGRLEEDSTNIVEFIWVPEETNVSIDKKGREFRFRVEANGDHTVVEADYDNNAVSVRKFVGKAPEEEEFNWRPLMAMLSLLIVFLGIYAVYRWRKKI